MYRKSSLFSSPRGDKRSEKPFALGRSCHFAFKCPAGLEALQAHLAPTAIPSLAQTSGSRSSPGTTSTSVRG